MKELRRLRDEWERRLPVVEQEIEALTEQEIEQGWAEAYETEWDTITNSLAMSQEEMRGKKIQARECDEMVDDLRLEADDLEMDADEALMQLVNEEEKRRSMELDRCTQLYIWDRERQLKRQRLRWCVKSSRSTHASRIRNEEHRGNSMTAEGPTAEESSGLPRQRSLHLQYAQTLSVRKRSLFRSRIDHGLRVNNARNAIVKRRNLRMFGEGNVMLRAAYDVAEERLQDCVKRLSSDLREKKSDNRQSEMCQECGCAPSACKCEYL